MTKKRTFREKLADAKDFPRVQQLTGGMEQRYGPGKIVIPAPLEVDALMRKIPKGKVTTINQIRECLARRHRANVACPIVTGIHARIAAGAAGEHEAEGKKRVTPYWRTLKGNGELNAKYPGGVSGQRRRLRDEGVEVEVRDDRMFVKNYEQRLKKLD
ncbi:MAG: MGMT family protein [bacterium]|nr:MGMT family protein [bacterium]